MVDLNKLNDVSEEQFLEALKNKLDKRIEEVMRQPYKFYDLVQDESLKKNDYVKGCWEFWHKTLSETEKMSVDGMIEIAFLAGMVNMSSYFPEFLSSISTLIEEFCDAK